MYKGCKTLYIKIHTHTFFIYVNLASINTCCLSLDKECITEVIFPHDSSLKFITTHCAWSLKGSRSIYTVGVYPQHYQLFHVNNTPYDSPYKCTEHPFLVKSHFSQSQPCLYILVLELICIVKSIGGDIHFSLHLSDLKCHNILGSFLTIAKHCQFIPSGPPFLKKKNIIFFFPVHSF